MALLPEPGGITYRLLRELVLRHRRLVLLVLAGGLAAAAFEGSTMAIFALALDLLTSGEGPTLAAELGRVGGLVERLETGLGRNGLFLALVGLAVLSQLTRAALQFGADAAAAVFQARVEGEVRGRIFRQQMSMTYSQFRRYNLGDLSTYMAQVNYLGQMIQRFNAFLGQVLLLAAYLVVLLWLSWQGTLIAATAMILATLSLRRVVRRIQRAGESFKRAFVRVSERALEYLNGIRLVHIFGREGHAIDRVDELIAESVTARRRGMILQASLSPLVDSLAVVGVGLFLVAGVLFIGQTVSGSLARYATFLFVLYRLAPRLSVINKTWGMVNHYLPFARRIALFLRREDKELYPAGGSRFRGLRDAVELQQVSMLYADREVPAVDGISLRLQKGRMLALVGESGSGKSTIADLLLRLYDPTSGRILVDGVDLRDLDWESWRARIGVVSQDTFLFNASIRENIAFGKLDATEEEILEAASAAHAHEFIVELPRAYDTQIGDLGHALSGGQRQRLAIARAILRDPDILVLDEATSDVDSRSERLIEESLARLSADRAVLAVAHRLFAVARADRILMLERGRILEEGSHAELLRLGGAYATFWKLQSEHPEAPELPADSARQTATTS